MSNFYSSPIEAKGMRFATVEHYFQAEKCRSEAHYEKVRTADTPAKAKKLGRSRDANLRPDWEEVKISVMEDALRLKYEQNPKLKELLLKTGMR